MKQNVLTYLQIQSEFDRIVAEQNTNFLAMKLRWLEVGPKVIALAEAEQDNDHICTLLQQSMDDSDEGQHKTTVISCRHVHVCVIHIQHILFYVCRNSKLASTWSPELHAARLPLKSGLQQSAKDCASKMYITAYGLSHLLLHAYIIPMCCIG